MKADLDHKVESVSTDKVESVSMDKVEPVSIDKVESISIYRVESVSMDKVELNTLLISLQVFDQLKVTSIRPVDKFTNSYSTCW